MPRTWEAGVLPQKLGFVLFYLLFNFLELIMRFVDYFENKEPVVCFVSEPFVTTNIILYNNIKVL
jgi:hypothetical protein